MYKGEEVVDIGTAEYLSAKIGVSPRTIKFYATESYKKRREKGNNYYIAVELPEINWAKIEPRNEDR